MNFQTLHFVSSSVSVSYCNDFLITFLFKEEIDEDSIVAECAKQNGLSDEDLKKWIDYEKENEEKYFCFMLCCHQKDGSLDKDGKWNQNFLDQHLDEMYLYNSTLKTQIKECFSNIPPIRKCEDMKSVEKCIPEITVSSTAHRKNKTIITPACTGNFRKV